MRREGKNPHAFFLSPPFLPLQVNYLALWEKLLSYLWHYCGRNGDGTVSLGKQLKHGLYTIPRAMECFWNWKGTHWVKKSLDKEMRTSLQFMQHYLILKHSPLRDCKITFSFGIWHSRYFCGLPQDQRHHVSVSLDYFYPSIRVLKWFPLSFTNFIPLFVLYSPLLLL